MNRWMVLITAFVVAAFIAVGCSGDNGNPVALTADPGTSDLTGHTGQTQTHLWGYYTVYMDLENGTVEAVPMRHSAGVEPSPFNVVNFVNGNPANLKFNINECLVETDHVYVNIDVGITHPFPGMDEYNGYDVRGIFIGDGHGVLDHNGLKYAIEGTDQFVGHPPDPCFPPDPCIGVPDGYTRWWNPTEFQTPGVLGYTPGLFATPDYDGSATLNPYMYFADEVAVDDNLHDYFTTAPGDNHRAFTAGSTNTRNYCINFPTPTPNVKFNYAIMASWKAEDIHPAYSAEASGIVTVTMPDLYFVDTTNKGGSLILDMDVFGISTSPVEMLEAIYIESDIFTDVYELSETEMIPLIDSLPYVSTYHCEVEATNLTESGLTEFWIMLEYTDCGYQNDFGVPNDAGTDPLISYFRNDLYIADTPYNSAPVCDFTVSPDMPADCYGKVTCDATGCYDPDGDPFTFHWDFDGDGTYDESPDDDYTGDPDNPTHIYTASWIGQINLRLVDDQDNESECYVDIDITVKDTTLYEYWAEDDGAGDLSMACNSGHSVQWTYMSTITAWDENGNTSSYSSTGCSILRTPQVTLPAVGEVSAIHMVVNHKAYGHTNVTNIPNATLLLFSTDNGSSWTGTRPVNNWTFYDGYNFPTWSGGSWFAISNYSCCNQAYLGGVWTGWEGLAWHGNFNSWRDSDFILDESQWNQDINIGLCWRILANCYVYPNHYGYQVQGIKVYVDP